MELQTDEKTINDLLLNIKSLPLPQQLEYVQRAIDVLLNRKRRIKRSLKKAEVSNQVDLEDSIKEITHG